MSFVGAGTYRVGDPDKRLRRTAVTVTYTSDVEKLSSDGFDSIVVGTYVLALCTLKQLVDNGAMGKELAMSKGLVTDDILVLVHGELMWIMGTWLEPADV